MTQTTTTAPARFVPATGLTATVNGTEVTAFWVNAAGWKVQARTGNRTVVSQLHQHEHKAVEAYNALVAQHTAAPVEPAPALAPAAKGTQTKVSDPQHVALAVAAIAGRVERGGKPGQFSVKVLTALAKRGYLDLTYQAGRRDARRVVTGGTLTGAGRIRLAQLTAAEREAAKFAARLAAALNPATPAQLVNA